MRARRGVVVFVVWALGAGVACGRGDAPVPLGRVSAAFDVVTFAPAGGSGRHMPRPRAEWVLRRAVRETKRLRTLTPAVGPGWSIDAEGLLELDPSTGEGHATASVELGDDDGEGWPVRATRSAKAAIRGTADRAPLERALAEALEAAAALESLRRSSPTRLRAALRDDDPADPERLVVAARALAQHHHAADVQAIAKLLRNAVSPVREAATGALVLLGDRAAVRPLIEADDEGDPLVTVRTVDAVSALGGDEALAYVELVAEGHSLVTVRRAAYQARRRLLRGERRADAR